MSVQKLQVRQRRDLTFKPNLELGRHGWLRLTPAYSVALVGQILRREDSSAGVFDPFSGTATTALAAANLGRRAFATDINPFLVWLGRVKTARFTPATLREAEACGRSIASRIRRPSIRNPPDLHRIERWWPPEHLAFLCSLRRSIDGIGPGGSVRSLLDVAFCRTMIDLSNAAFNHQSMSFSADPGSSHDVTAMRRLFLDRLDHVLSSARPNPPARAKVILDDARTLRHVRAGSFDLVVTSPPYPNRMSYIRELRPYMYWLGHLNRATEAAELDWRAIGGTWGSATSRVARWRPPEPRHLPDGLIRAVDRIGKSPARHAALLANYVHKYFHDMSQHVQAIHDRIATGGRVHYIVGNSTFYGVLVDTELILARLLDAVGFTDIAIERLRKRNSKRELFEFGVSATKTY